MATKEEDIAQHEKNIRVLQEEVDRLRGGPAAPSLSTKHTAEDEAQSLFDRMSSAELMELYQTDREKWQQVMDSVQSAGERKLAKLSARPFGQ